MNWRRFLDHLLPRNLAERADVKTIVSVVYTTAPKTFDGPAIYVTAGAPVAVTRSTVTAQPTQDSSSDGDDGDDDDTPTTTSSSRPQLRTSRVSSVALETATPSTTAVSTTALITSSAIITPTAIITTPTGAKLSTGLNRVSVSSAAASATTTPTDAKSGMSGGGIAGLIFGLLLGIGLIIGLIIFFNKRQKRKLESHSRLDDEKAMTTRPNAPPVNPSVGPYPTAPRISLRPGSQFSPSFGGNAGPVSNSGFSSTNPGFNSSNGFGAAAAGGVAAAAAATASFPVASQQSRSVTPPQQQQQQQQPLSGWERPRANNAAATSAGNNYANDPANPFGNHAETLNNSPPRDAPLSSSGPEPATEINAADFPLPASGTSTPVPRNLEAGLPAAGPSPVSPVGTALCEPSNAAAPSPVSPAEGAAAAIAAGAAIGAVGAGAGAAAAAASRNDNNNNNNNNNNGPQSPAKPAESKVHRVQMDFQPSMDDEIPIRTGQLVKVQHEYDDGWALVSYMDGSRSGVCPRTCLSKHALQPRPKNGPPPHMNNGGRPGPNGMRGPPPPGQQGRPMSPAGGRGPNGPFGPGGRPHSPAGRSSPGPYGPGPRSQSPFGGPGPRPQSPYGAGPPRSGSPANAGRARSGSSASAAGGPGPFQGNGAYGPGHGRSMSPGPYGAGGLRPTPRPDNMRRRSNSMGQMDARRMMQPQQQGGAPRGAPAPQGMPSRKPVGGA